MTIREITPDSEMWPAGLRDLADMPERLWVRSYLNDEQLTDAMRRTSVAVVGSRAATAYGEHVTAQLVGSGIAANGWATVSGLAYGIDAAAHRAALIFGGITLAYLARGVDDVYPRGHDTLADRVMVNGALISEHPPGTAPTRHQFLSRNRLIAAHTQATLVVEAGVRSGSISTANHAKRLGRPVGAAPGPLTSPASIGTNLLIQTREAHLIQHADDVRTLINARPTVTH